MADFDVLGRLHSIFSEQQWVFAKTMPENPHEYALRKKWVGDSFDEAVKLIRSFGYTAYFKNRKYIQFNVLDRFYWTMGAPLPETILINRAKIDKDKPAHYDTFADKYDKWFQDEESRREDASIASMANEFIFGSVLDVGCGTGTVSKLIRCDTLTGIDPSSRMLSMFAASCPGAVSYQCRFEDFPFVGYDSVVSFFGSMNYTPPEALKNLDYLLNTGGRYFLVFLAPGYSPVTHKLANVHIPFFNTKEYDLPTNAVVSEFHNYLIVKGEKSASSLWK